MPGVYYDINSEEYKELVELLPNAHPATLERYLQDTDGIVRAARRRYLNHEEWRKSDMFPIKIDEIIDELNLGKLIQPGFDRNDQPYIVFRSKLHFKKHSPEDVLLKTLVYFTDQTIEKYHDLTWNNGHGVTIILDCTDAGIKNVDKSFMLNFLDFFRRKYPAYVERIIIFNLGYMLQGIFTIISPLLHPQIRKRIKVVNGSKNLSEYVDIKEMWQGLGGKKEYFFTPYGNQT